MPIFHELLSARLRKRKTDDFFTRCEEVYQAVRCAVLLCNVRPGKKWKVVPRLIFADPDRVAAQIKKVAQQHRARFVQNTPLPCPTNIWERMFSKISRNDSAQASYLSRAMPVKVDKTAIRELKTRMTSVDTVTDDTVNQFRGWVHEWLAFYRPSRDAILRCSPSGSGCIEMSRSGGGNAKLIPAVIRYQQDRMIVPSSKFDFMLEKELRDLRQVFETPPHAREAQKKALFMFYGALNYAAPFMNGRPLPIFPVLIGEKGGRTRVPTLTLGPVTWILQAMRSAVDPWLNNDPRMRGSQNSPCPLKLKGLLPFRSQDLTKATDLHSHKITKVFYQEVGGFLDHKPPWWDDAINLLGPFLLIKKCPKSDFREPPLEIPQRYLFKGLKVKDSIQALDLYRGYFKYMLPGAVLHLKEFPPWKGTMTTRGEPMGCATSWPLLPILTAFCFETSSPRPIRSFHRTISKAGSCRRCRGNGYCFHEISNPDLKVPLLRYAPRGALAADLTGDDAVMRMSHAHSLLHTMKLQECGAEVSPTKDFFDEHNCVYTERLYHDLQPVAAIPIAVITGVRGVRSCNWYNQAETLIQTQREFFFPSGLTSKAFSMSIFVETWKALSRLGFLIYLPTSLGGLGVPGPSIPGRITGLMRDIRFEKLESLTPRVQQGSQGSLVDGPRRNRNTHSIKRDEYDALRFAYQSLDKVGVKVGLKVTLRSYLHSPLFKTVLGDARQAYDRILRAQEDAVDIDPEKIQFFRSFLGYQPAGYRPVPESIPLPAQSPHTTQ